VADNDQRARKLMQEPPVEPLTEAEIGELRDRDVIGRQTLRRLFLALDEARRENHADEVRALREIVWRALLELRGNHKGRLERAREILADALDER
jgi:hypothetical protein